MKTGDLFQFVMMLLVSVGLLWGILYWLKNLLEDVHTQITGIWTNSDSSFKVLIYSTADAALQGDVVWADSPKSKDLRFNGSSGYEAPVFHFWKGKLYQSVYESAMRVPVETPIEKNHSVFTLPINRVNWSARKHGSLLLRFFVA